MNDNTSLTNFATSGGSYSTGNEITTSASVGIPLHWTQFFSNTSGYTLSNSTNVIFPTDNTANTVFPIYNMPIELRILSTEIAQLRIENFNLQQENESLKNRLNDLIEKNKQNSAVKRSKRLLR